MAISKSFFFWKAKGDSSDVDDEAKGFRGTRGQRRERDIIHPLLNLSQRAEESDQKLNVVLILCAFACVCVSVRPRCACAGMHVFYVCERACQDGSSIWKINNHITWEDQACSLELTADRILDKSTVLKRESGSDTESQTHRCRHQKSLTFYTRSTPLLHSFFTPNNQQWPPYK